MVLDLIKDNILSRIEDDIQELEHDIKFVNTEGNKWQAVIEFDLDKSSMSALQKQIVSQLLKYL